MAVKSLFQISVSMDTRLDFDHIDEWHFGEYSDKLVATWMQAENLPEFRLSQPQINAECQIISKHYHHQNQSFREWELPK